MLFGRDRVVADLLAPTASVVLLEADKGVGKSSVLALTLGEASARGWLAPELVALKQSPASLQRALIEGLATAAAQFAADQPSARRLGEQLLSAAGRVAQLHAADLARGVGRLLLSAVRARIGEDATDLLTEFVDELRTGADDVIEQRIRSVADPDVMEVLCSLARELCALLGDRQIVIGLDEVNRLRDEDLARLADLAGIIPEGLKIIGAYTNTNQMDATAISRLALSGVNIIPLLPLTTIDVGAWLRSSGLDENMANSVHERSNGYALYVEAAIGLLSAGQSVADLSPDEMLIRHTEVSWREMSVDSQECAVRLSAIPDRPPLEQLCEYLGIRAERWIVLERELIESRILIPSPAPWFHALRQGLLLERFVPTPIANQLRQSALQLLATHLSNAGANQIDMVGQIALISDDLSRHGVHFEDQRDFIVKLTYDELAVLASFIEIAITEGQNVEAPYALGDELLLHARNSFGATGDLIKALDSLSGKGLVVVASNQDASVVVASLDSEATYQLIVGRAGNSLARPPIPKLSAYFFRGLLGDLFSGFFYAEYGIGERSLAEMSQSVRLAHLRPPPGRTANFGRHHGLLIRASWGDLRFFACFAYDSAEAAHLAATRLASIRHPIILAGSEFRVETAFVQPGEALPSRRMAVAFGAVLDVQLGTSMGASISIPKLDDYPLEKRLADLTRARSICAYLSTELERAAVGYERHYFGALWDEHEVQAPHFNRFQFSAIVAGKRDIERIDIRNEYSIDPAYRYKLAQRAKLPGDQRLLRVTFNNAYVRDGLKVYDPIAETVLEHEKSLRAFNQSQTRKRIFYSEEAVAAAVQIAMQDREALAADVAARLGRSYIRERSEFLIFESAAHDPNFVPGAMESATLFVATVPGEPRTSVRMIDDFATQRDRISYADGGLSSAHVIRDTFEITGEIVVESITTGSALGMIARLLGCGEGDVWLEPAKS